MESSAFNWNEKIVKWKNRKKNDNLPGGAVEWREKFIIFLFNLCLHSFDSLNDFYILPAQSRSRSGSTQFVAGPPKQ